jgi:hypothetical protein
MSKASPMVHRGSYTPYTEGEIQGTLEIQQLHLHAPLTAYIATTKSKPPVARTCPGRLYRFFLPLFVPLWEEPRARGMWEDLLPPRRQVIHPSFCRVALPPDGDHRGY